MNVKKPKPKLSLRRVTKDTNNQVNQSKYRKLMKSSGKYVQASRYWMVLSLITASLEMER